MFVLEVVLYSCRHWWTSVLETEGGNGQLQGDALGLELNHERMLIRQLRICLNFCYYFVLEYSSARYGGSLPPGNARVKLAAFSWEQILFFVFE